MKTEIATRENLKIKNVNFKRREHGERQMNKIDHILIEMRYEKNFTKIRTYRGSDVDTDHFMLDIRIRRQILRQGKGQRKIKTQVKWSRLL